MKKNQNKYQSKNKKRFLKNLSYGAVTFAVLGGLYITLSKVDKHFLNPENFRKAEWIEHYNSEGRIWNAYTNENIPKNVINWHLYIDEVREKNKGNLEGRILLPDLDGNGKVGR